MRLSRLIIERTLPFTARCKRGGRIKFRRNRRSGGCKYNNNPPAWRRVFAQMRQMSREFPYLRQALSMDVGDGKTKTTAMCRNCLAIGIDHQNAAYIVAPPTDQDFWVAIIGLLEFRQRDERRLDGDGERIGTARNFAQLVCQHG